MSIDTAPPELLRAGLSFAEHPGDLDRRALEAERVAAALQRRADAAERRVSEARERLRREREEREEALAELTGLLDAERRRGTAIVAELEDQAAELRVRVGDGETALEHERADRARTEAALTAAAHERLAEALADRDATEFRLSAALADHRRASTADLTRLREELAAAQGTREALQRELLAVQVREEEQRVIHEREQRRVATEQTGLGARVADAARRLDALGTALGAERSARAAGAERERELRDGAERAHAALAGEQARREELLVALRQAELRAHAAAELEHTLALRERERDQARAEARGAQDAVARLQADVGTLQQQLAGLSSELQAERVARGTADAVLLRERAEHAARLAAAEGAGTARLEAERTEFARERVSLEGRVKEAETAIVGERAEHARARSEQARERSEHERERDELACRLTGLKTDIERTIGELRRKLEAEVARSTALGDALEARARQEDERSAAAQAAIEQAHAERDAVHGRLAAEAQRLRDSAAAAAREQEQRERAERQRDELAAAQTGVQRALAASEARAAALDAELRHREELVERVGHATVELREHLALAQSALAAEGRRREATEFAAREVVLAAQDVLLAGLASQEQAGGGSAAGAVAPGAGGSAAGRGSDELVGASASRVDRAAPGGPGSDELVGASASRVDRAAPGGPGSEAAAPAPAPASGGSAALAPSAGPRELSEPTEDLLSRGGEVVELRARRTRPAPEATVEGELDELTRRFDKIRAELASRGVRAADRPTAE